MIDRRKYFSFSEEFLLLDSEREELFINVYIELMATFSFS